MNPGDVNLNRSGFGDPEQNDKVIKDGRSADITRLVEMGRGFLETAVPTSNVILDSEFQRYIPLFNKEAIQQLGEKKISALYDEYRGRFSMQHPIKIVVRQPPGPGDISAFYPPDKEYYKVIRVLPPMYHRVRTLNDLGPKVCALIDAFFNTSRDNDVQHKAKNAMYAKAIAEAIHAVNSQDEKDETLKDFIALDQSVRKSVAGDVRPEEGKDQQADETSDEEEEGDKKTQPAPTPMSDDTIDWF